VSETFSFLDVFGRKGSESVRPGVFLASASIGTITMDLSLQKGRECGMSPSRRNAVTLKRMGLPKGYNGSKAEHQSQLERDCNDGKLNHIMNVIAMMQRRKSISN
jgi:hypothetical protein